MRRLITLIIIILLAGCATANLEEKVTKLEARAARVEMMALSGFAAANFYPARDVDWEGAGEAGGDLDYIPSTADQDVSYVMILGETYFGPTLNLFMPYILDGSSAASEDFPWVVTASDGGTEDWLLADVVFNRLFGKMYMSNETGDAGITVNDWDTGTYFVNSDADDIEFDLPADPTDLTFCFGNGQTGGTVIDDVIAIFKAGIAGDEVKENDWFVYHSGFRDPNDGLYKTGRWKVKPSSTLNTSVIFEVVPK